MTITINGKESKFDEVCSIAELLTQLGFSNKPVIVEHNKEAIFPRDYMRVDVQDGDILEIISIAAGG